MEVSETVTPDQRGPEPVPEAPPSETGSGAEPAPAPRRRRRVARTIGLLAVAAVLGLVGGTAVGYRVQADREPVALPPLNQPGLAYPAKPLPGAEKPKPLPAAEDLRTAAEGDLRKLLVAKPAGAKANPYQGDGWVPVQRFAAEFTSPGGSLDHQLDLGIRRIAQTAWATGAHRRVEVRLIQYRAGDVLGAREYIASQQDYMPRKDYAGGEGTSLKGSADGRLYVFPVERKPGYLDFHHARAYFYRGDIAVEIFISDTKKISAKDIGSLAERQLERL
ncbi:hypothetical protein [Streptomyces termitum]|uniref:hypothetical protein n=1 Tax=Streptomyces termitum TaxID=67368 RepID=UPI0033B2F288